MGKKFVLIGAGSYVFTRNLVRDILSFPAFQDATIALVDIDDHGWHLAAGPCKASSTPVIIRLRLLRPRNGAKYSPVQTVFYCMLMAQPLSVFRRDLEICLEHGVPINVGDTRNPAGILPLSAHSSGYA